MNRFHVGHNWKKRVQRTCQISQMVHVFQEIPHNSNKRARFAKNPDLGFCYFFFIFLQFAAENHLLNNDENLTIFSKLYEMLSILVDDQSIDTSLIIASWCNKNNLCWHRIYAIFLEYLDGYWDMMTILHELFEMQTLRHLRSQSHSTIPL